MLYIYIPPVTGEICQQVYSCRIFGLSFERPYLMEGLNLMIACKIRKKRRFQKNHCRFCRFQLKTTDFDENHRFDEIRKICEIFKNHEIHKIDKNMKFTKTGKSVKSVKSVDFYVKRKTTCLRR